MIVSACYEAGKVRLPEGSRDISFGAQQDRTFYQRIIAHFSEIFLIFILMFFFINSS